MSTTIHRRLMNALSPSFDADAPVRDRKLLLQLLGIATVFWVYLTLSNVFYTHSLSAGIDPSGTAKHFASWRPRVLQHLFLYPILIACLWGSLQIGWRQLSRALPLQLLLSLIFAASATPALAVAEHLVDPTGVRNFVDMMVPLFSGARRSLWIAGTISFELTYGFALALIGAFLLYQQFKTSELRRLELERAWSETRLESLRAQLSPHTLFNLLHAIRGYVTWDPPAAQAMIVQLGDLLRRVLAAGTREFSMLREELKFAQLYLELHRKRYEDRVKLSLPDLDSVPAVWLPSLILQPLVENAVVHGLRGHEGEVTIRIEVVADRDALVLRVLNSMANGSTDHGAAAGGIGLRNVRERLAVHFGDRAQLIASADDAHQWRAELHLPLLQEGVVA